MEGVNRGTSRVNTERKTAPKRRRSVSVAELLRRHGEEKRIPQQINRPDIQKIWDQFKNGSPSLLPIRNYIDAQISKMTSNSSKRNDSTTSMKSILRRKKHSQPSVVWREQPKECRRLEADKNEPENRWREWGPYLSERQWGTVREDYSDNGTW